FRDASVFNSQWAPGWNSNQSIFKFQTKVGGPLKQASQGERLLGYRTADTGGGIDGKAWYEIGNRSKVDKQGFEMFPLYHLFGSEELSAQSEAIQARATNAYVALNP